MIRARSIFLLPLALLLLAACSDGGVRETLGLDRQAPDEFSVVSRPPLSLPPEFELRPPRPGEPPRGPSSNTKARALLIGEQPPSAAEASTVNEGRSSAADRLLNRAGTAQADGDVRSKLDDDVRRTPDARGAGTLLDRVTGAPKAEPVIDAKKEAERLRSNKDSGKPINDGAVPEEEIKPPSVIDRLF